MASTGGRNGKVQRGAPAHLGTRSLVSDSVTCYHAVWEGEIWKLDPPNRRNSKKHTCPNGDRHVGGRPAERWLPNELILTGLEAAIAISHEFLMRVQVNDAVYYGA